MAIHVRRLVCNVTVRVAERKSPLNKDAKAARPELQYRAAPPVKGSEAPPTGAETATESKGPAAGRAEVSAAGVDPHRVADRVYELMKAEIRQGRLREQGGF